MAKQSLQARKQSELKKGRWTGEEDEKLIRCMEGIKEGDQKRGFWPEVPKRAGLNRSWKSCWLRWREHLKRSGTKKGKFSEDEDNNILKLQPLCGNKWSLMAEHFHDRTGNEIKNRWHNNLKKKVKTDIHGTSTHTPVVQPLIAGTDFPISSPVNYNITPQLTNELRLPLHSQGPSSFNNLTMDDQLRPLINGGVPSTGSILNPPTLYGPLMSSIFGVSSLSQTLLSIDNYPAQANQLKTSPNDKACLEFVWQFLMNDDDDIYRYHSSGDLDPWMALISV